MASQAITTISFVAYPTKLLSDGEDVVAEIRPHWSFMLGPILATAGAVVAAIAAAVAASAISAVPHDVLYVPLVAIVVGLCWLGGRYLRWSSTLFVITTERLVLRSGVLARRGREILLRRVNDLTYTQSILERMLGCGAVIIESGGERGQEAVPRLPQPDVVQRLINEQISRSYRSPQGPSPAWSGELSIPEQIEKLDELCRRGIITPAEMQLKRAQLLERW